MVFDAAPVCNSRYREGDGDGTKELQTYDFTEESVYCMV